MAESVKKVCGCKVCLYSKVIRGLVERQTSPGDKRLVEELYNNLIHAEDDADYWRIHAHGGFEKLTEEVRKHIQAFEERKKS